MGLSATSGTIPFFTPQTKVQFTPQNSPLTKRYSYPILLLNLIFIKGFDRETPELTGPSGPLSRKENSSRLIGGQATSSLSCC